jgi:hypothetical protein
MMHLAAYYKSVDPGAVLTLISAVPDQAIFTSGNDVRVPKGMGNLLAEAALSAATTPIYGQVQSPSLRQLANQDVSAIATAAKFQSTEQGQWHFDNPRALQEAESVNFGINATGGAAAANYGLIWLGDGAVKPTQGKIFTVRATGAAGLAAGQWVNTPVAFNTVLPAGSFQVVGFRAEGANLIAARIVFVGAAFRPGVPAEVAASSTYFPWTRDGNLGVLGSFDVDQPPTIDCLGATDTVQAFYFDLIQTG